MLDFKKQQNQVIFEERIVMGVTPFKDVIEGKEIDTCNVFIVAPFDSSRGAIGFGTAKVPFGKSDNVHRFSGIQLPATLELAFQEITSGSGKSKKVLVDFRIPQSQPTPKKD